MSRIDRDYIARELSKLTQELRPETTNHIFKKENSALLNKNLNMLKILADACDPADSDLLMQFLEISDPRTDRHLGHLTLFKADQATITGYLDILKALHTAGISPRRIYALLNKKERVEGVTFARLIALKSPISDSSENKLSSFYDFLVSLKRGEENALKDEDILHLFAGTDNSYFESLHTEALLTKRFCINYLTYLSSLIVESSAEAPINLKISEMMQAISISGDHSGTYIIREHTDDNERVKLYFQLLEKLYRAHALSDSALLKILLIPNNHGMSLLSHLYLARPDNLDNLQSILELLKLVAKKTGPAIIQDFLKKQTAAEGATTDTKSFSEILVAQHSGNLDLIIRMIRNNFFSDASLRDLAPLSKVIAGELLSQAAKTRDHATAIALLQEALPPEATTAGAGSALTKPKAPLAHYFELDPPKSSSFSLFSPERPSPIAQIKRELERRSRARDAEASGTTPSIGISSLN